MSKSAELVLVIPTQWFHETGYFQGFRAFETDYVNRLLSRQQLSFRLRSEAELNPDFKQLIPYVALRFQGKLFHYRRGKSGTETRLQALRSIGIGGHICEEDSASDDLYRTGMLRELTEEVDIDHGFTEHWFGLINDDRMPVGKVHLGIVHIFDLATPRVQPREAAIAETGFASIQELFDQREQFETWSQFVLEAMIETIEHK